jgi:hypothetical protein
MNEDRRKSDLRRFAKEAEKGERKENKREREI